MQVVSFQTIIDTTVMLIICVTYVNFWLEIAEMNSREYNNTSFYSYNFIIKNFELVFFLWICCAKFVRGFQPPFF